jgi:hypothetical protein
MGMSIDSGVAGWAEPVTEEHVAVSGRHRADTVSNGVTVEELLVRVGREHD